MTNNDKATYKFFLRRLKSFIKNSWKRIQRTVEPVHLTSKEQSLKMWSLIEVSLLPGVTLSVSPEPSCTWSITITVRDGFRGSWNVHFETTSQRHLLGGGGGSQRHLLGEGGLNVICWSKQEQGALDAVVMSQAHQNVPPQNIHQWRITKSSSSLWEGWSYGSGISREVDPELNNFIF